MFKVIDDGFAVLKTRAGVYKQVKIYERAGKIYAGYNGGFILLTHLNGTGVPDVRLDEIHTGFAIKRNEVGFLVNPEAYTGKVIAL